MHKTPYLIMKECVAGIIKLEIRRVKKVGIIIQAG